MPQSDLYSLLKGYTLKVKSPYVNIKEFLVFIEKYAQRLPPDQEDWNKWKTSAKDSFWEDITALSESGQCVLLLDKKAERVFIPAYCRMCIENAYSNIDNLASVPLPNEETLKFRLPENYARSLNLNSDIKALFYKNEDIPIQANEIILLNFPYGCGSVLLLSSMIPKKLLEISILKIRHYLQGQNNKEYIYNKLLNHMQGKEKIVRDIVDKITVRPLDCAAELEKFVDFQNLFWTYFCSFVKNDIKKRNEMLPDDISVMQAVCVIEIFCSIYRMSATNKREIEAAFKSLETMMDRSPWNYTLKDITAFTNDRGTFLLDIYNNEELEEYIKKAITDSIEGHLPSWLVIHGEHNNRWFIKKERYIHYCAGLITDVQLPIKTAIIKRWTTLLNDYTKESAMNNEAVFEKLLETYIKDQNLVLYTVLTDPKLQWAFQEMNKTPNALHQAARIFNDDGQMLPYSTILSIRRADILSGIKASYPFWHSIPFIYAIVAFFKKLGRGKNSNIKKIDNIDGETSNRKQETKETKQYLSKIEEAIVPVGRTIDEYLEELEDRWSCLLEKKDRDNLIKDVQSLLRHDLTQTLKINKGRRITLEGLNLLTEDILKRHSNLRKLKDQKSLCQYMKVYMLKLIYKRKN